METGTNKQENTKYWLLHLIISHSYAIFLFFIILGLIFDLIFHIEIFTKYDFKNTGLLFIILGSIFVYWAEHSTRRPKDYIVRKIKTADLMKGPYKYLPHPAHLGVFLMALGLAIILDSFFSVVFAIISYIIVGVIFQKKEEKILESRYGQVYLDYKNKKRL